MKKSFILLIVLGFATVLIPSGVSAATIGGDQAWFNIHTNVDAADIYFDDDFKGATSGGKLTISIYTSATPYLNVTATASGYKSLSKSLPNVSTGETVDVYLTLQQNSTPTPTPTPTPSTGSLRISSNPANAEIWVDDSYKGSTDMTVSLSPGTHNLELRKDGYNNYFQGFTVYTGSTTPISVTLTQTTPAPTPSTGWASVSSNPTKAEIWIDGWNKGITEKKVNLLSGRHNLELRQDGYDNYYQEFEISGGSTTTISVTLTPTIPSKGTIMVSSSPPGGKVFIDGNYKGVTPSSGWFYVVDETVGSHNVQISLSGYQIYVETVSLSGGQSFEVKAQLIPNEPTIGSLQIASSPIGAEIYLNGENSNAITPYTATNLQPDSYNLTLQLPGYQEWSQHLEVIAGQSTVATATLIPVAQPTKSPLGFSTVIGTLVVVLAIYVQRRK